MRLKKEIHIYTNKMSTYDFSQFSLLLYFSKYVANCFYQT